MNSARFRRILILLGYTVIIFVSLFSSGSIRPCQPLSALGLILFIASTVLAYKVHSMYPERHDKPEDFPELLTNGPYAYCRHPFYLALILNKASIPLYFCSLPGLLVFALTLPAWLHLIRIEERELVEYWGEKYIEYMQEVPALIPRLRRKK